MTFKTSGLPDLISGSSIFIFIPFSALSNSRSISFLSNNNIHLKKNNSNKQKLWLNKLNLEEIRKQIREVNIGRELHLFSTTRIPDGNQISARQMAWLSVAILYCDISGYTALTNANRNETIARILVGFHSSMVLIVNQFSGRIVGFAGDRVLAVFDGNEEHCANNAVACRLAMQTIVRKILNDEFEIRNFPISLSCLIGIDFGRVLMGGSVQVNQLI
jgi:hypothetical protein